MRAIPIDPNMDEDLALIKKFLEFQMDEESRSAFEARLETDDELVAKLADYQKVQQSIRNDFATPEELSQQEKWGEWLNEDDKQPIPINRKSQYLWWSAVAAAVVAFGFFIGAEVFRTPDFGALAEAARQEGPELKYGALRGTDTPETAKFLLEGYDLLQQGKHSACIQHFSTMPDGSYYHDGLLILSMAYQKKGELQAAINCLGPILQEGQHPKFGMASWQASLLYLELNQPQSAIDVLRPITANRYRMAKDAKDLLEKLSD